MMKLAELKAATYDAWEFILEVKKAIAQPENFKAEVKLYGDLRSKATWRKAFAVFEARGMWLSGVTEHTAIVYIFGDKESVWDEDLRYQMLEQFLTIPGTLEFLLRGFKQIFQSGDKTDWDCAYEFLEMVSRKSGRTGTSSIEPLWRLAETYSARAS